MGFTTNVFLFLFFPSALLISRLCALNKNKGQASVAANIVLAFLSTVFYAWAIKISAFFLLFYVALVYCFGSLIGKVRAVTLEIPTLNGDGSRDSLKLKPAKALLAIGVACIIVILFHFKYLASVAPFLGDYFYIDPNRYASITVPLGISFISFSAISYLADIYRGNASPGTYLDCYLYLAFFPKVVSGPIVPWEKFQPQLFGRQVNADRFVDGINRMALGFGKKVVLADTLGACVNNIANEPVDSVTAWFGWILYAMQLYYDFAGYSDIAIGLAEMFGFHFEENFHFPYRSCSVTEFWRRWHISLGTFFRTYLYIPLGGNRKGYNRTLLNLGIVFAVTGIWHGAGLAYVLWGCIHGACVIFERVVKEFTWYKKTPGIIKWGIAFFICVSAWQLFRYGNLSEAVAAFSQMMGIHTAPVVYPWQYYIDAKVIVLLVVSLLGATVLGNEKLLNLYNTVKKNGIFFVVQEIFILLLFVLAIIFMMSSTYSPFIYFQF